MHMHIWIVFEAFVHLAPNNKKYDHRKKKAKATNDRNCDWNAASNQAVPSSNGCDLLLILLTGHSVGCGGRRDVTGVTRCRRCYCDRRIGGIWAIESIVLLLQVWDRFNDDFWIIVVMLHVGSIINGIVGFERHVEFCAKYKRLASPAAIVWIRCYFQQEAKRSATAKWFAVP